MHLACLCHMTKCAQKLFPFSVVASHIEIDLSTPFRSHNTVCVLVPVSLQTTTTKEKTLTFIQVAVMEHNYKSTAMIFHRSQQQVNILCQMDPTNPWICPKCTNRFSWICCFGWSRKRIVIISSMTPNSVTFAHTHTWTQYCVQTWKTKNTPMKYLEEEKGYTTITLWKYGYQHGIWCRLLQAIVQCVIHYLCSSKARGSFRQNFPPFSSEHAASSGDDFYHLQCLQFIIYHMTYPYKYKLLHDWEGNRL